VALSFSFKKERKVKTFLCFRKGKLTHFQLSFTKKKGKESQKTFFFAFGVVEDRARFSMLFYQEES